MTYPRRQLRTSTTGPSVIVIMTAQIVLILLLLSWFQNNNHHHYHHHVVVSAFTQNNFRQQPQQQQQQRLLLPTYCAQPTLKNPTKKLLSSRWTTLLSTKSMLNNNHNNNICNNKKNNIIHRKFHYGTTMNYKAVIVSISTKLTSIQRRVLSILPRKQIQKRIRHSIITFLTCAMLVWNIGCSSSSTSFVGTTSFLNHIAHAASTSATTTTTTATASSGGGSSSNTVLTERILDRICQSDVDVMIQQYVERHMFDDDLSSTIDPIAGTYREAYYDHTLSQQYPMKLRSIITETLRGSKYISSDLFVSNNVPKASSIDVGLLLTKTVQLLQKSFGLSEVTATIVLAITFVVAGPSVFLLFGMIVGGISKRNMDQIFKQRYGETYTVDATIKQEPIVELPSEDDDDDDDDEEEDDDDDDDDDNTETKGKNNDKKK